MNKSKRTFKAVKQHIAFGELDVARIKLCQEIRLKRLAEVRS